MSLKLANPIAAATVAAGIANGYAVSAAVVDCGGSLRALQRADNVRPHTLSSSQIKACTSASAKNTTPAMMGGSQQNPAGANLVHMPGPLLLGGGVPIKVDSEVIDAVGVGGAQGGHPRRAVSHGRNWQGQGASQVKSALSPRHFVLFSYHF